MNSLSAFIRAAADHLLIQGLGWALLHSLWQGLLAAALLGATLPLMRGPRARYAACCATLALLVLLLPVTFWISLRHSPVQAVAAHAAARPVPGGGPARNR